MDRIEAAALVAAVLPLILAIMFRITVVPRRKTNLQAALSLAYSMPESTADKGSTQDRYLALGSTRVQADLDSLYTTRMFVPAFLLSLLYVLGLSLAVSMLTPREHTWWSAYFPFEWPLTQDLVNPVHAVLGAYVFSTGVLIRRAYLSDVTKNVYWGAINRLFFSVGLSIALVPQWGKSSGILSFCIAFFPGLFVAYLRRFVTKTLAVRDGSAPDLSLQLVQGIDIWKQARLSEEGIESVQNLATADVLMLMVKMNYPLRTVVDWMDQAIMIQRFPTKFALFAEAGLPLSAVDFLCESEGDERDAFVALVAKQLSIEPVVVRETMLCFAEDNSVRILRRLWQRNETAIGADHVVGRDRTGFAAGGQVVTAHTEA